MFKDCACHKQSSFAKHERMKELTNYNGGHFLVHSLGKQRITYTFLKKLLLFVCKHMFNTSLLLQRSIGKKRASMNFQVEFHSLVFCP